MVHILIPLITICFNLIQKLIIIFVSKWYLDVKFKIRTIKHLVQM